MKSYLKRERKREKDKRTENIYSRWTGHNNNNIEICHINCDVLFEQQRLTPNDYSLHCHFYYV